MKYMRDQVPSYLLITQCDPTLQTFCYMFEVVSKLPRFTLHVLSCINILNARRTVTCQLQVFIYLLSDV